MGNTGRDRQEPRPALFNPGLSNTCTLGVVCPPEETGRCEIWDAQQATKPVATHAHTNPGCRKEVVSDFFSYRSGSSACASRYLLHIAVFALLSACPALANSAGGRRREQDIGDGERQGRNEITWGLICPKVKKLNLFNSVSLFIVPELYL